MEKKKKPPGIGCYMSYCHVSCRCVPVQCRMPRLHRRRLWCALTLLLPLSLRTSVFPQSHCIDLYAITSHLFTDGDDDCFHDVCYVLCAVCNAIEDENLIIEYCPTRRMCHTHTADIEKQKPRARNKNRRNKKKRFHSN